MKIIIGFSRSKSMWKIGSSAIQIAEKRDYSHAYIRLNCPISGLPLVAQASHGFVNMVSYDIFKEQNIVAKEYEVDLNDAQFLDMMTFICQELGVPYGKIQIILIAIKKIIHLQLPEYNKDKYFICSEFAARICQVIGFQIKSDNLDYMTPSDLDTILSLVVNTRPDRIKLVS